jgi:hypothetical protein
MANWEARAKKYEALWRSALAQQAMCADHIKGDLDVSFSWDDGKSDRRLELHSDEAERLLADIAHAVVFHALTRGSAGVTLTAHKAKREKQ